MIKFNYDIKSRELKNFLDFEISEYCKHCYHSFKKTTYLSKSFLNLERMVWNNKDDWRRINQIKLIVQ